MNLFQPPAGLLGDQEEAIRQQMQMQGLLGLAAGLFQAGTPSRTPQSLGGSALQGLMAGQQMANETYMNALKLQEYARQRQEQERASKARQQFESQLQAATKTVPSLGITSGGQQANMLAQQMQGFAPEDLAGTQQALMSAGATQQVTDQSAADQAVMNYLRVAAPVEYAKLAAKEPRQLPAAIQEYAFARTPEGGGFKGTFQEFLQSKTPSTNVSLSTEKSYGGALAGEVAKSDALKFEAANAAPKVIETVQTTRNLLDSGNVITGLGAQQRLDLARFGQLLGVTGKDTNQIVANTQQLFANRAQATLDSIRSSGLGSGQGFSNKDREFLENARLGNITYSPDALRRQLDIEEKVARASVSAWNNRLKNIPQDSRQSLGLKEVQLPSIQEQPKPRIPRYNPVTGRVE